MDEPPTFAKPIYNFNVVEEQIVQNIGAVTAKDPDRANKSIRYNAVQNSPAELILTKFVRKSAHRFTTVPCSLSLF